MGRSELYSKFDRPNLWAYRQKEPVVAVVVLKAHLDCPPSMAATRGSFSRRSRVWPLTSNHEKLQPEADRIGPAPDRSIFCLA